MGIQIANVWHFGLRLTTCNTVFNPALGELCKSTQFAPKFTYLRSKIEFFLGQPRSQTPPPVGGDTASPYPPPSALRSSRLRSTVPTLLF